MSTAAPRPIDTPTKVDYVALPAGALIGRYQVASVLGQGGFGITYLVRDTQLGREVAIKEYLPAALAVRPDGSSVLPRSTEVADDFGWGRSRFIEEGRTLANLHEAPSIVRVFDFLEANGTAYIVMELLRGRTLEDRVKAEGPLPPVALQAILGPLLAGLHKVHETGFLHRDIKPANIMLGTDGKPTLIDFGAARAAMADRTKTMTAIFTPGYAAPEQFTSAKQGPWTDIYGLSATLHYAITGRAPPSAFDRLMEDTYVPLAGSAPREFDDRVLRGIDAGLSLALEKRPSSIAAWWAPHDVPADSAPTLVMPPAPSAAVHAVSHRSAARRGWLALGVGVVLAAMAGAYVTFAPAPTPQGEPATSPSAGANQPSSAEATETALNLSTADRRRIQLALTAQGFDTRGSDGTFGPRSREMIAAWQQAQKHPATGYLTAAESQALRDASPPSPRPAADRPAAAPVGSGFFVGSLSGSATGGGAAPLAPMEADLRLAGGQLSGRIVHPVCGSLPVSLAVDAAGTVSGGLRLPEAAGCTTNAASASGRLSGGTLTLNLRGADVSFRGTLSSHGAQPSGNTARPPGMRTDMP
ncbi:Putative peptidoglycan binding domain-containing protein [Rhodospirillales bacterium URHD0017]|nr:Putative peptidoglycan binding domain-containing protein [Rhodospirillales bacterium URHD0017]